MMVIKTVDLRKPRSILQQKAILFIDKTRNFPKKMRWASFDKNEFESLLSKVTTLNNSMMYFFEKQQRDLHFQMQQNTYLEILQTNNKLDDLFKLMASLTVQPSHSDVSGAVNKRLVLLTRFKALNVAVQNEVAGASDPAVRSNLGDATSRTRSLLPYNNLSVLDTEESEEQPFRSSGLYQSNPVWVEWRYYEAVGEVGPPPYVEDRISKLAVLLRDEMKPNEFQVPACLGYVHDPEQARFGYVFKCIPSLGRNLPLSLYELISQTAKPSLTTRLHIARSIATSIWYLHATNWLHKGFRSDAILFQILHANHLRNSNPQVAGFDYSRPDNPDEVTERPGNNRLHDLYRHPSAQFDIPRDGRSGYRKIYDIYSLGVVLFEVGMWSPIHTILGINISEGIRSAAVKGVKSRLLDDETLACLEAEAGDIFAAAVETCLSGDFGTSSAQGRDSNDAHLQVEFGEKVVYKLDSILA